METYKLNLRKKFILIFMVLFSTINFCYSQGFVQRKAVIPPTKANIPFQFGNPIQWLDGTISGNQFIDQSGNGYNVDIINNDIDSGVYGFPYKSNALIAQKAANFGIIPDPTNFWYTTGGVPNQIPVSALFQNIDYANQIFTRHIPQQLAFDSTEVAEPKVMDIVSYSAPLSGSYLTNANAYFKVPIETTVSVVWVDGVNGNDANAGTKASPYQTLTKANIASKTIYIKSAAYTVTASIYYAGSQTWNFIGYCPVTSTITPIFGTSASNSCKMQGAIITPASGGRAVYFISGNNDSLYRCKMYANGTGSKNFQIIGGTGASVKYCLFENTSSSLFIDSRVAFDLYGCNFAGSLTDDVIQYSTTTISGARIYYNKFKQTNASGKSTFLFNVDGNYYIKYNIFKTNKGDQLQHLLAGPTMTGTINWNYNTILPANLTSGVIVFPNTTNTITANISNNVIGITTGTLGNGVISMLEQPAPIINYNYIDLSVYATAISISATSPKGPADISYNTILTRADGGSIVLGSDMSSAYDNAYNTSTVIGNKCYGIWYFNPTSAINLNHGIAVFNCIDVVTKYNYCNGTNHCIVYKASDRTTAVTNTAAVCAYNIGINNDEALFAKTMAGIKFFNNTTYADNPNITTIAGGFYLLGSTGPAINNTFQNNIFIDKTPANPNISLIRIDPTGSLSGLISNNNVFYSQNNAIAKVLNPGTTTYTTLASWQAAGYDVNSIINNVNFFSQANEQWWPVPQINNAVNVGPLYRVGLDISTNYNSIPNNIIMKFQSPIWQNGAYIQ